MRISANGDSAIIEIALQFVLARYIRVSYSNRQGDIYPAGIKVKVLVAVKRIQGAIYYSAHTRINTRACHGAVLMELR